MTSNGEPTSAELRKRLAQELRNGATEISLSPEPARAVSRAGQRRRRRIGAGMVAGLTGFVGTGYAAVSLQSDTQTLVATAELADEGLDLAWSVVGADVGWVEASFEGADGYRYALSTAPGVRYGDEDRNGRLPQAIYRTSDGETWEAVSRPERRLGYLSERDGQLYALSTAPGPDDSIVTEVVRSGDNGNTWSGYQVPLSVGPPSDPNGLLSVAGLPVLSLAVGDNALIVTATWYHWVDDATLAEYFGLEVGDFYSEIDGDRLVVRDYTVCNAWAATFEGEPVAPESGDESEAVVDSATQSTTIPDGSVEGEAVAAMGDEPIECSQPPVVVDESLSGLGISDDLTQSASAISTDGENWTPVEVPGYQVWFAGGVYVSVDDDGNGGYRHARSIDGVNWTPLDTQATPIDLIGVVGDRLVGHTYEDGQVEALLTSGDGGLSWQRTDLVDLVPNSASQAWIGTAATGDLGAVAVVGTFSNGDDSVAPTWTMLTSADGVNWTATPVADVADVDDGYPAWAFVDADRIGVVFDGVRRNDDGSVAGATVLGTPRR